MKILILLIAFTIAANAGILQILHPVKWSYGSKKLNSNEAVIFLKATIDDGWHIYSTTQKVGGPVKTTFAFNPSAAYTLSGKITEPTPIILHEEVFAMDVNYFEHEVIFSQKIKLAQPTTITGTVKFMVCNDKQCLPPEMVEFSVPVK